MDFEHRTSCCRLLNCARQKGCGARMIVGPLLKDMNIIYIKFIVLKKKMFKKKLSDINSQK